MELWQLHLIMAFSCLVLFFAALFAIRRFFLGRVHLQSEFQGVRRKGDGPIIRSANQIAADATAVKAVAVAAGFASSVDAAPVTVRESDVDVGFEKEEIAVGGEGFGDQIDALRRFPLLGGATAQELALLAQHVRLVAVPVGEAIFSAGDLANAAYVIKSGTVLLVSSHEEDDTSSSRKELVAGDFFGEQALGTAQIHTSTAIVNCDCQLWVLERSALGKTLAGTQELSKRRSTRVQSFDDSLRLPAAGVSFELLGLSDTAPTLVPQQQTPAFLMPPPSAAQHAPASHLPAQFTDAALEQHSQPAVRAAATGGAARVPKSLLKKHAGLFDV